MRSATAMESTERAPSHDELLARAHGIRTRALEGDVEGLVDALVDLRDDVVRHVDLEVDLLAGLPGAAGQVVCDGQRRILALIDRVGAAAAERAGGVCTVRLVDLELLLRRQSRLEAALLRRTHRLTR